MRNWRHLIKKKKKERETHARSRYFKNLLLNGTIYIYIFFLKDDKNISRCKEEYLKNVIYSIFKFLNFNQQNY